MKGLGWMILGGLSLIALLVWSQRYNWGLMVKDTNGRGEAAKGGRGMAASKRGTGAWCPVSDRQNVWVSNAPPCPPRPTSDTYSAVTRGVRNLSVWEASKQLGV